MSRWFAPVILISLLLSACGPSEAEMQATTTQVAAELYGTQTALAPTAIPTDTPTVTPTPTETPTRTQTPTITNTPRPPTATLTAAGVETFILCYKAAVSVQADWAVHSLIIGMSHHYSDALSQELNAFLGERAYRAGGIVLYKDCSEIEDVFIRPASGSWKFLGEVFGTLTVKNQEETEAYIVLLGSDADEKYIMYARAGEQMTMEDIPDGSYELYFTNSTTWVTYEGRFRDAGSYRKLTEPLGFTSTATQAIWWEITLQTVEGGNTESMIIDEDGFP